MSKIIKMELISKHHDNPLIGYFRIKKSWEFVAQKYYWSILKANVKSYIKRYNICLILKVVRHKPYGDLQFLLIPIYWWKNLSINFVIDLPISSNWKRKTYNLILVIIDRLMKMIYYEPVIITIDALSLEKVILNMVIWYYGLLDSIVSNRGSIFTSKFWSLLYYFFGIKQKLLTIFHPQIDGQTERQNSTIEAYLQVFINFE